MERQKENSVRTISLIPSILEEKIRKYFTNYVQYISTKQKNKLSYVCLCVTLTWISHVLFNRRLERVPLTTSTQR